MPVGGGQHENICFMHFPYPEAALVRAGSSSMLGPTGKPVACLNKDPGAPVGAEDIKTVICISKRRKGEKIFGPKDHFFDVHHYAQSVRYDATGFTERNKDGAAQASGILRASTHAWLQRMVEPKPAVEPTRQEKLAARKKGCVANVFVKQVEELVQYLRSTRGHYVPAPT